MLRRASLSARRGLQAPLPRIAWPCGASSPRRRALCDHRLRQDDIVATESAGSLLAGAKELPHASPKHRCAVRVLHARRVRGSDEQFDREHYELLTK